VYLFHGKAGAFLAIRPSGVHEIFHVVLEYIERHILERMGIDSVAVLIQPEETGIVGGDDVLQKSPSGYQRTITARSAQRELAQSDNIFLLRFVWRP
jgi:hypothetical protein